MPDFPIVDSHVHLADPSRFGYDWTKNAPSLKRLVLPADLAKAAAPVKIDRFVFVEVDVNFPQHLGEAEWVAGLAQTDKRLAGMVAALPLERGKAIEFGARSAAPAQDPARHQAADPDPARSRFLHPPRFHRRRQAARPPRPRFRYLHPAPSDAECDQDGPPMSGSALRAGPYRQAWDQGRNIRSLAPASQGDGEPAECALQDFGRFDRGRSQELDARAA